LLFISVRYTIPMICSFFLPLVVAKLVNPSVYRHKGQETYLSVIYFSISM
jgi:hypothetical protein